MNWARDGDMRRARWLATWRKSEGKPVLYHCISRIVDRQLVMKSEEKEKFRTLMRIYEKFTGCRVLAYCLMDNHFHLLLEIPPMPPEGISDAALLQRLAAIYDEAIVAEIACELTEARKQIAAGHATEEIVARIHMRYTYRMHDLGEFMKGLLQRYTQWHNRRHKRTGRLWEDRFKSIIVEDGVAAKTIAAYIDLNPIRAGIVREPADYRWCSYGEAIGGGSRGNGKTARAGLVRALRAHKGIGFDDSFWRANVAREYRKLLMAGAVEKTREIINPDGKQELQILRKGIKKPSPSNNATIPSQEPSVEECIPFSQALRCRIRYFADGVVIGSRTFVNEAFTKARERFGPNRKDGARKLRGPAAALAGQIWNMRELRKEI